MYFGLSKCFLFFVFCCFLSAPVKSLWFNFLHKPSNYKGYHDESYTAEILDPVIPEKGSRKSHCLVPLNTRGVRERVAIRK